MRKFLFTLLTGTVLVPMSLVAQKQENGVKEQYLEQVKKHAAVEAKVTAALLRKKYGGDEVMERTLYKVFYDAKLAVEETSVKYAETPELENRLAEVIAKNDSVTNTYLQAAKNKGLVNNKVLKPDDISKFAAAVRLKNELALTTAQVDSMVYHTNRLAELRLNDVQFSPKDYERGILPRLLNDEQYTSLLVHINQVKAEKAAQNDWKELKQRGLLPGADSAKVVAEIVKHNIGKWSVADRYDAAAPQLSAGMKAWSIPEPQAMQLLRTARRYNNPITDQPAKPAFRW